MKKETFIIVIPAYNEEGCISNVASSWMNIVKRYPGSEMLVINDGSKDKTGEKLEKLKEKYRQLRVIHKKNEGHGATVMKCYEEAVKMGHTWIFQTDSDNQHSPKDFNKLWSNRHKSDFILGYRLKRDDSLTRLVISKIVFFYNLFIFGAHIKDANIAYRLIKSDYLRRLLKVLPKNLFAPNIFLSILAVKDGQNTVNIAVKHKARKTGQLSIYRWKLLRACIRVFIELSLFRLRLHSMIKALNKDNIKNA